VGGDEGVIGDGFAGGAAAEAIVSERADARRNRVAIVN
jgi:hypothetical protein